MLKPLPISLYIHIPWCARKCPYCDFNSHQAGNNIPEEAYIEALIKDLDESLPTIWGRPLCSIFIGGGTPSLFSASGIGTLLQAVYSRFAFNPNLEITMEANPGTFEQEKFKDFKSAGVNRLSIGIQSFQSDKLKSLGRIHDGDEAMRAVDIAHNAGFDNFNLDLMHGLPGQSVENALYDLETALRFEPPHLSWYQLTLEPNTVFAKFPPTLPKEDLLYDIQEAGNALLKDKQYQHYEISAYAKANHQCTHNLNYWQFGDYLGIGAGAHSKITDLNEQTITRLARTKLPQNYLNPEKAFIATSKNIEQKDLLLEFMMNILRTKEGVEFDLIQNRTGLEKKQFMPFLEKVSAKGFVEFDQNHIRATSQGHLFLNDCLETFICETNY
jgi:putative oxygen-independent coproporphyrinogen III oxidase